MSRKIKTEAVDNLFEGILSLKSKEKCSKKTLKIILKVLY